jgi:hypothetical protein
VIRHRVGLLADTHGRDAITVAAVRLLLLRRVDLLIHLGDVGSLEVLEALADPGGHDPPLVHVVFGNVDYDRDRLSRRAAVLGLSAHDGAGRIVVAGKTLVFAHGQVHRDLERALDEGVDYFCHGHTHVPRDDRVGRTRVLNPGALHRTFKPTVGWLDVLEDRFDLIEVPRAERG